jgi:hypothetical protein
MASEQAIPNVPVRVVVPVKPGDATLRIQSALDYVAALPAGADGIRGAVLLNKGLYQVNGSLKIKYIRRCFTRKRDGFKRHHIICRRYR